MKSLTYSALILLIFAFAACNKNKTGTCHIRCISSSTGAVYSDEYLDDYTKEECDSQYEHTTTDLVPCTVEWN